MHSSSVAVRRYDGLRAIKFFGCKELLLHFVHLNGLSPVWVASCAFKFFGCEKLRSHFVQLNAF